MDELVVKARQKQPGLIVVDRAVHGKNQNYLTPENRVPDKGTSISMGIVHNCRGRLVVAPDAKYMSGQRCCSAACRYCDQREATCLLNIAPGPLGQWHDGAYKLLEDIGAWMKVNSEAIYGTRALAPYKEGKVCISKKGKNTIFIYYMADEGGIMPSHVGMTTFLLPEGSKVEMVGTGTRLKWQKTGNGFDITIPEKIRKSPPSKYVWVMRANF